MIRANIDQKHASMTEISKIKSVTSNICLKKIVGHVIKLQKNGGAHTGVGLQ